MYISANQVNVTQSYTPNKDWHHPAQLGRKRLLDQHLNPNWERTQRWKLVPPHRGNPTEAVFSEGSQQWGRLFRFNKLYTKIVQIVRKPLYLPDRLVDKSQSPFFFIYLFFQKHHVQEQKKKQQRSKQTDKQTKNNWSPLRTFGH